MSKSKDKYNEGFVDRLKFFLDCPVALITKGVISDTKIAILLNVSRETVRRWRTIIKGFEGLYKPKFAETCHLLQEQVDTGDIHKAMTSKAKGFTQIKVVREPKTTKPELPALSSMNKKALLKLAKTKLGLKLSSKLTIPEIKFEITRKADEMSVTKLVITKRETVTQAGSETAAQLVLQNIGETKKRWQAKQQLQVSGSVQTNIAADERKVIEELVAQRFQKEVEKNKK